MKTAFWAYIVTNHKNSVLYTGVTNDLERRILEHKNGIVPTSFSKKYRLYKLVWFEAFSNPGDAISAEKKIKGWTRDKKNKLIETMNKEWSDLTKSF